MRKFIFAVTVIIMFLSCSKQEKKDDLVINLATGITPRVQSTKDVIEIVEAFRTASASERSEILTGNQWLTSRLVAYARSLKQIPEKAHIDSVVYYYGSADAQAEDWSKKIFKGKIIEEPVGFIYFDGKKTPVGILVYCQNGTFGTFQDKLVRIGASSTEFTIERGFGINKYVDYQTSIMLAEYFSLPLYSGKKMSPAYKITPQQARDLENKIAEVQVTVKVFPCDYFNLGTMTYRRAH